MQSGSQQQTQNQPNTTNNAAHVNWSLLSFAVGQINVNVSWRMPARPPLRRAGWTHWVFVLLVGGFGAWSAWWLVQFGLAHASHPKWLVPIGLFGAQVCLSLVVLEWGFFGPRRAAQRGLNPRGAD